MSTTQHRSAAKTGPSQGNGATFFEILSRSGARDPEEQDLRRRFVVRLVAFAVLLAGHVWIQMESRNLGYEEQALGRLIHRLDQERVEIEDQLARESRPALLASRAAELGMQKPVHGQLRRLAGTPPAASPSFPVTSGAPAPAVAGKTDAKP
jgi:hypothetical protein